MTRAWLGRLMAAAMGGALLLASASHAFDGDTLYAKPGRIFTASDGARLNFYCRGKGPTTVIFEAGEGDWSPAWASVQPAVSRFTRTCSYDRAGAGFSGPAPLPTYDERFVAELYSALRNGGIRGPYILVGHATGGDIARAFADLHMNDVAGMVLIDPAERDVETTHDMDDLWRGIDERNAAYLKYCRDTLAAGKPLTSPPADHPGWTCLSYSFRGIPDPHLSTELNDAMVRIMSTKTAMYAALYSGVGQRGRDEAFLRSHRRSLGSRPLRIILAAYEIPLTSRLPAAERIKFNDGFKANGAKLLDLSSNAKLLQTDTGAFVQFDKPQIVIDAIREVYDQSRRRAKP